ncbi:unnamed protein product, partial [Ascophyllum nodosum]
FIYNTTTPCFSMALPAKLQRNILSWVGETAPTSSATPKARVNGDERSLGSNNGLDHFLSPTDLFSLSDAAAVSGSPCVVVKDGFLGRENALRVHEAALQIEEEGEMKPAGMGRGEDLWHGEQSRGDRILWITDGIRGTGKLPQAMEMLLCRLSALRGPLNRASGGDGRRLSSAGLHLVETTSVQLARYPGGGKGYVRHRDTPKSAQDSEEADRKVSAIYYLNLDWEASMGGQLRVHLDAENGAAKKDGGSGRTWDINPVLDRLVLFRSDLVDHEVLPAFAPRLAVTLWFYGRQLGIPAMPYPPPTSARSDTELLQSPSSPKSERLAPGDDTRENVRPLPTADGDGGGHAQEASIFVSIVSYRDSEANPTIVDLFERASNPARVSVGLVWQLDLHASEDAAMHRATPTGESLRGGRVRSLVIPAVDAAGPSWARRVAQSLWNEEKYLLQIDSHTRFRPGWDSYLIRTLQRCPSFKPILTTYPVGYQLPHKIPAGELRPTLLVPDEFGPEGMLRQKGRLLLRKAKEPLPSPLWASGFSFSGSALLLEVPYDPGLRHSFFGEEISMAARMYTRGWEFFAPPQTVIYHLWSRAHRPSFRQVSTPITQLEEARAKCRLRRLLGVGAAEPPVDEGADTSLSERTQAQDGGFDDDFSASFVGDHFGLGTARTLASFEERLGVDFCSATVTCPDARNAGRPATDFNDSIASGLEGVLKILNADTPNGRITAGGGGDVGGGVGPCDDEDNHSGTFRISGDNEEV